MINVRMYGDGKERFQVLDGDGLVILKLQALSAKRGNGNDARAERRAAPRLFDSALAHLQQAGVNSLLLGLVVNLAGALAFQNHRGNARRSVPHRKVTNRSPAGQRKNIVAFLDGTGVDRKSTRLNSSYLG